ncbi:MetQ/NlpA family ABC transporter substrate-binding protein [Roseomonas marmotae]|uniref:Lipoprotein n=1 Tax=Roseomonas marmotae TaxID=2768161 RepID=A0ABS3KAJ9_9PROT|nr:MetQ/NlpA family ABC transporter substrate-binding protein [Roseomonas marmotae]MBO1074472.1 MetQ/NlpA family ABC transporter substrate-binding protein [Roseomonas marmotae]QTI78206.1 MetQ/NlpA family ABC transporter substrate-binding protein [Roseomonas marmotae]
MTINRRVLLGAGLALPFAAAATAQKPEIGTAARPLTVGATAGPHSQVMEKVQEIAARDGLVIKIVPFTDYITPNAAVADGDLDANSYQHQPFLDQTVRDRRLPLVAVGKTLVFPMGIYSRKHKAVADIPNGTRIAIPNDPTNGGRALVLLAANGAFKLRDGADFRATVADVTENPKRLRILELEAAQIPRALDEVEAAAINTNFAIPAGLNPVKDSIALESADSPYANLIAVHRDNANAPWVKKLLAAYQNDEIKDFVRVTFQGSVVPAF